MSQIRHSVLYNNDVIIAPERLHRSDRSNLFVDAEHLTECPFCEGNEAMTPPEIFAIRKKGTLANSPGWRTRVIPNLYKAVQIETVYLSKRVGMYEYHNGFGAHEIIIDTPIHKTDINQFDLDDYRNWLFTIQARISDLANDKRMASLTIFKNIGVLAGATQTHPHTQIIGLPIVSNSMIDMTKRKASYFRKHTRTLMQDVLEEEAGGGRMITDNNYFAAFCPYASSYPFEVCITIKDPISDMTYLDEAMIEALVSIIDDIMKAMYKKLGKFDMNIAFYLPPLQKILDFEDKKKIIDKSFHFFIRIMPRIYRLGGFEVTKHIHINPVEPESCAKFLRSSLP